VRKACFAQLAEVEQQIAATLRAEQEGSDGQTQRRRRPGSRS
jgi:hypothetical protein